MSLSRRLLMGSGAAGSFTPVYPTTVTPDGARQTLFSGGNIYAQDVLNRSGTWYFFYVEGSSEHSGDSVAKYRTSTDDGVTWSAATTFFTAAAGRHGGPASTILTSGGRIISSIVDQSNANPYDVVAKIIYSDDGSTWSSPYTVPNTFSGDCVGENLVELPNGDIVLFAYGEQTGVVGGNTFSKCMLSTDHGATFGSEVVVAASASRNYQEPTASYINGVGFVCLMRSDTNVHTWLTTSADRTTWTAPVDVLTASGPPDHVQFYSGRLFMVLRNDNTVWRGRTTVSLDSGATWSSLAELDTGETRELDSTAIMMVDSSHIVTIYALLNTTSSSTVFLRKWVAS